MKRPEPGDCAAYYFRYIDLVPDGDILAHLQSGGATTLERLSPLTESQATFAYAPGKWTIKDVLAHMIDTERVFSYRALSFARQDPAPLPGMDQDDWAASAGANERPFGRLLEEFQHVRSGSIALFQGLGPDMFERRGIASDAEFRVRSIPWILAGHDIHHRRVLEERYVPLL